MKVDIAAYHLKWTYICTENQMLPKICQNFIIDRWSDCNSIWARIWLLYRSQPSISEVWVIWLSKLTLTQSQLEEEESHAYPFPQRLHRRQTITVRLHLPTRGRYFRCRSGCLSLQKWCLVIQGWRGSDQAASDSVRIFAQLLSESLPYFARDMSCFP